MDFELKYSPEALDDLDRVWTEVLEASHNVDVADKYVSDLRESIRQKKKAPKTGNPVSFLGEFTGIYSVSFKKYMTFYRIRGNNIEIGRILFSGSDYIKTLFGKSEYVLEDEE